jgi:O-antigen/teichoic acid export membrane protein
MVLARLLCPEDFGIVALIMVFVGLADVLVDGGLGNALIQSKEINKKDIYTVFTTNLSISVLLFVAIFLSAPAIAAYVEIKDFDLFLRVESVMILIRAFYVVHFSLANRQLAFKVLARIGLTTNFIATLTAILLAYYGFGVWSLIFRNLALDLISCLQYFMHQRIGLKLYIDKSSFKRLWGFGFFVAVTNLLESAYSNILSFIIGKKFKTKELGYYNQAHALEQIPVYSMSAVLNQVFFPFLSKIQDEKDLIKADIRKSMMCISFIMFPLMTYLVCFARPIIVLLYSDKWLPAAPFFQMLCIAGYLNGFYHLNRNILKAVGKTKYLFFGQLFVCVVGLLLVLMVLPFGIKVVVGVSALTSFVSFAVFAILAGRQIDYGFFAQIRDVSLNLILSIITGLIVMELCMVFPLRNIIMLIVMTPIYGIAYFGIHYIIRSKSYELVYSLAKRHLMKNKNPQK